MSDKMIAIVECASGNGAVGSMWLVTAIFHEDTPLHVVRDWAYQIPHSHDGKLILSEPTDEIGP